MTPQSSLIADQWQTIDSAPKLDRVFVVGPSEVVHGYDGICEPDRMNDRTFDEDDANMRYIAACNPVAMREVLAAARKAEALQRENAELRKVLTDCSDALGPFSDAVFNDNGDMTVNLACASGDDLIKAYFVNRRARALLGGENADH